jgi:hypothetical protein
LQTAQTFQDLAGSGYLAVIYADGNGVGSAAGTDHVERAVFFHRNRVLLRRALQTAINNVCQNAGLARAEIAPFQLLMLGGDDLLVVCRVASALPFVVALCDALAKFQRVEQSVFELTLGVGIVLARPTIPVHRFHEVAERLAASAKRRFRGFPREERRSVVDWAVYTASWLDDPEDVRRRDWVRGTTGGLRVLSRRPIDVLGDGLDSLQGLLGAAEKIKNAPRSQLRYLVDRLPLGRALSELAFAELSREARDAFQEAGIEEVWTGSAGNTLLTSVFDLVEISEIRRLGRAEGS